MSARRPPPPRRGLRGAGEREGHGVSSHWGMRMVKSRLTAETRLAAGVVAFSTCRTTEPRDETSNAAAVGNVVRDALDHEFGLRPLVRVRALSAAAATAAAARCGDGGSAQDLWCVRTAGEPADSTRLDETTI